MRYRVEIEDIEEMRRREGIDDVELREQIRGLRVGDCVKLTLMANARSFETMLVRITSIRGRTYRGKLAHNPATVGLTMLPAGMLLAFTAGHIHSVAKRREELSSPRTRRGNGRPHPEPA
jgi:hypothetical protein